MERLDCTDMKNMTEELFDKLFKSGIILKDSVIYTNAVVSRRIEYYGILALGDDGKEILCSNRTILRCGGECFSGQRLYCGVRHRRAVSYCTIPEMTYGELTEFFKKRYCFRKQHRLQRKVRLWVSLHILVK